MKPAGQLHRTWALLTIRHIPPFWHILVPAGHIATVGAVAVVVVVVVVVIVEISQNDP